MKKGLVTWTWKVINKGWIGLWTIAWQGICQIASWLVAVVHTRTDLIVLSSRLKCCKETIQGALWQLTVIVHCKTVSRQPPKTKSYHNK